MLLLLLLQSSLDFAQNSNDKPISQSQTQCQGDQHEFYQKLVFSQQFSGSIYTELLKILWQSSVISRRNASNNGKIHENLS